jgi:hypothetical protein
LLSPTHPPWKIWSALNPSHMHTKKPRQPLQMFQPMAQIPRGVGLKRPQQGKENVDETRQLSKCAPHFSSDRWGDLCFRGHPESVEMRPLRASVLPRLAKLSHNALRKPSFRAPAEPHRRRHLLYCVKPDSNIWLNNSRFYDRLLASPSRLGSFRWPPGGPPAASFLCGPSAASRFCAWCWMHRGAPLRHSRTRLPPTQQ